MAGKGYNYAYNFEDDWYDDEGEIYEPEDDAEDPELAAAVEAAKKISLAGKSGQVRMLEPQACFSFLSRQHFRNMMLKINGCGNAIASGEL